MRNSDNWNALKQQLIKVNLIQENSEKINKENF